VASITLDGKAVSSVDLHATSGQSRRLVMVAAWASSGRHTLKITCRGTAGHPRIDLDAFVVIR